MEKCPNKTNNVRFYRAFIQHLNSRRFIFPEFKFDEVYYSIYETKYSQMDPGKFMEESLLKP